MAARWGAGRQYGNLQIGWSKDEGVADSYVIRTDLYTFTVEDRDRWTFTATQHRGGAGLIDYTERYTLPATTKAQALAEGSRMLLGTLVDAADDGLREWLRS